MNRMGSRERLTVAVLFGGCSDEYGVSLKSVYSVLSELDEARYHVIMIGITKDGKWRRYRGSVEAIREDRWDSKETCVPAFFSPSREFRGLIQMTSGGAEVIPVDVVLPVLHGKNGEDGTIQGLLELAGIPYTGCGVLGSAAGMDKAVAHSLAAAAGVAVARSGVFYRRDDIAEITRRVWKFQYPLFVKPANGGSSIGMSKVEEPTTLISAVKEAFQYDEKIVIEENVPGFEVGCAILGYDELSLGAVDELQLHGLFFDYKEKYNMTKTVHHVPARISGEAEERVKEAAKAVYRALECRGIARIDFFLTPEGEPVFNEVNTMPGFTTGSRCPKMLMAGGLTFGGILDRMIGDALRGDGANGGKNGGRVNDQVNGQVKTEVAKRQVVAI